MGGRWPETPISMRSEAMEREAHRWGLAPDNRQLPESPRQGCLPRVSPVKVGGGETRVFRKRLGRGHSERCSLLITI